MGGKGGGWSEIRGERRKKKGGGKVMHKCLPQRRKTKTLGYQGVPERAKPEGVRNWGSPAFLMD